MRTYRGAAFLFFPVESKSKLLISFLITEFIHVFIAFDTLSIMVYGLSKYDNLRIKTGYFLISTITSLGRLLLGRITKQAQGLIDGGKLV